MHRCEGKEVALDETRLVFNSFTSYLLFYDPWKPTLKSTIKLA